MLKVFRKLNFDSNRISKILRRHDSEREKKTKKKSIKKVEERTAIRGNVTSEGREQKRKTKIIRRGLGRAMLKPCM